MIANIPCSLCDKSALKLTTEFIDDRYSLVVEGFNGPCRNVLGPKSFEIIENALQNRRYEDIFNIDKELLLGWCRTCEIMYCKDHWQVDPVLDDTLFLIIMKEPVLKDMCIY